MNKVTRCYLSALALSCTQVQAAPILQVQDGILTGAKYVEVAGAYYDVEFSDGTCIAIFTGCDNATGGAVRLTPGTWPYSNAA